MLDNVITINSERGKEEFKSFSVQRSAVRPTFFAQHGESFYSGPP